MKLSKLLVVAAAGLLFTACKKDDGDDDQQGPNSSKLVQVEYKFSATETSVTDFQYDGAGRWIGYNAPDGDPLMSDYTSCSVVRNGDGIIQSFTLRDGSGVDAETLTYQVAYDGAKKQYTHRTTTLDLNGTSVRDSTVFDYNGGRITASRFLIKPPQSNQGTEFLKTLYTYDAGGNLITVRSSVLDINTLQMEPFSELQMTYDNKVAALQLGAEGIVLDQTFFVSPANISKLTFQDLSDNSPAEEAFTATYTYGQDNKPATGTIKSGNETINVTYKYN